MALQSEIDSLTFDDFMSWYQVKYEKEGLRQLIEHRNNVPHNWLNDSRLNPTKPVIFEMLY